MDLINYLLIIYLLIILYDPTKRRHHPSTIQTLIIIVQDGHLKHFPSNLIYSGSDARFNCQLC